MRSLLTLAVICNLSHTILAFPSIQQQLLLSKGGSLPVSTTTTTSNNIRNELSSKGPRCHHREPHSIVVHSTLRAGGGNSASQKINDTSMLGRYSQFVDEKPLLAKSMTAGIVTALANIFSQIVVASQAQSALIVSWSRVVVYMLTGMCFIGPYLHFWYGFLDRVLVLPKQKPTARLAIKVVVDQLVGVCIFYPPYFMFMEIAEATLLGRVPMLLATLQKCRTDLLGIALMNWRVWPITNAINFGIIPLQFRVLVNQIVSFFWFAYLSTRA